MPHTLIPPTTNHNSTIASPDSDDLDSPWYSWIPTPDVWSAAPTMLLPPAKPAPPVPIPDGVYLMPTDMLPPPMVNVAQTTVPSMKTLEAQNLDGPTWIDLQRFWSTAIKTALGDGDATLLRAYDAAFVVSLEKLRGPITADDHARIVAARGRGRSAEALKTLELPICADLPIERVMLQRAINLHS